jgi:gliding motility-associated-like protein
MGLAHAQQAIISAVPTTGCAPLTVVFNGTGSTGATSYSWTFGDVLNNTSTSATPNHDYLVAGTYTVTLSINGGGGALTTTVKIVVNAIPSPNFSSSDSSGCFPLTADFKDLSTSSNSTIVGWRWDFGDGDTSNLEFPIHTYYLANPGGFPVTLQVTDKNGCSNTIVKSGYIKIPSGVTPSFTTVASQGCKIPITVNLDNTSTGPAGSTMSYLWNFGDGTATSTVVSPSHTFSSTGNYPIKLVASSSAGCSDSITVTTPIVAGNVTSNFTAPDSICVNSSITFINTSAPTPTVSNWTFGDGTASSMISNITKTYTTAGIYTVKLTNTFGACIDSVSKNITVLNPAIANFTATNTVSCDSVFTVNFTDQSTGASNWLWNFGDGTTSALQNPTHTYKTYGSYSVTLFVSNANGCSGTLTKSNFVQSGPPVLLLNQYNDEGCAPFTFSPQLTDTAYDGIKSYNWNFGDGTSSTLASPPAHSYPNAGTYFVSITITTNGGCTATAGDTVRVGTIKPVAAFTAVPTTVCTEKNVAFTDKSTNNPNQWLWLFGDGSNASTENPLHSYLTPGTYYVTLYVFNNGCNDSAKQTITVEPPLAKFAYTFSCSDNSTVFDFHDSSLLATSWNWNFGDGATSTLEDPTHVYAVDSTYSVTLTVTNSTTGCTNTVVNPVFISHQQGILVLSGEKICINNAIFITPFQINYNEVAGYKFIYGDGKIDSGNTVIRQHFYDTTGTFKIYVILTENSGCLDTLGPDTVQVNGPTANFGVTGNGVGCTGLNATFIDQSKSDGISPIVSWKWNYGDSTPVQTYSGPPFTHEYAKQGIYTVILTVTDASGCSDSISKVNFITVAYPSALFSAEDSLSCPGSPIQFVNDSKGYGLTYTWNFGDGQTSNAVNPAHLYAIGTYQASLSVVDQYGCPASYTNYNIIVDTPHASFTVDNIFASCPPLTADFSFTGSYVKTFEWAFGDGGISDNTNPTHFYTIPGTYTATLTVVSNGGCTQTAAPVTITVLGPYGALSYTPLEGCHVLPVNFTLTTGDQVVKYVWIFNSSNSDSTTVPNTSFTYDSVGKYLPIVILESSTGCDVPVTGTDTIYVLGSKPNFSVSDSVLCNSGTVQFTDLSDTVGAVTSWQWSFGDGGTSNQENPSHFYANPGLYSVSLIVTVQSNCSNTITIPNIVKVVASPSISITGASTQCAPATFTFQGVNLTPANIPITWNWNFGNGNIDSVQNPAAQIYPIPGIDTVKLTATNSSNCSTTVSSVVTIDSVAQTNPGPDTAICLNQSAFLHASSSVSPANFTWLPPTNGTLSCTNCYNPVANPTTTTTYYVQSTNALGCGTIDSMVVTVVQPANLTLTPMLDSICLGQQVQLVAAGEQVYTWTPSSGLSDPSSATPFASPDSTTTYQVVGSDSLYCFKDTLSVTVDVFNYPTVSIGPKTVNIPIGTSYTINGSGSSDIDSINWTPTIGLSCANCLKPIASPITTTTYTVSVENNGGCVTLDSIKIIVTCNGSNIFVPNTFSPNGDGHNDWFFVQGDGLTTIQSMQVFNRWGQLVFEKKNFAPNDPTSGWDGNFNGQKAPMDVYIYSIVVVCENSQLVAYHGNVALIR